MYDGVRGCTAYNNTVQWNGASHSGTTSMASFPKSFFTIRTQITFAAYLYDSAFKVQWTSKWEKKVVNHQFRSKSYKRCESARGSFSWSCWRSWATEATGMTCPICCCRLSVAVLFWSEHCSWVLKRSELTNGQLLIVWELPFLWEFVWRGCSADLPWSSIRA